MIKQNVLRLQIPVTKTILVHISNTRQDLFEKVTTLLLSETSSMIDMNEEFITNDRLLCYVGNSLLRAIFFDIFSIFLPLEISYDVFVS